MDQPVTEKTIRQFVEEVQGQDHAMAGAVIAASAAQATALGQACLQISRVHQGHALSPAGVAPLIEQLANIKSSLVDWCDRDAVAIAEFVALREAGDELRGQQLLCDAPAEVSRLCLSAANILQDFRPVVSERVADDLELGITLLAGAAQAAMLLVDSNLRLWPEKALIDKYEPIRAELARQIRQLSPVARLRD
jgi:formiminotetrahydrofolate cyclodeaminase